MKKIGFIILAGGTGNRFKKKLPKQFVKINKYNSIENILKTLNENKKIDIVVIVFDKKYNNEYINLKKKFNKLKIIKSQSGVNRQESSINGLKALKKYSVNKVLIHDASRPIINNILINKIISNLNYFDGCAPIIKIVDLLRIKQKGKFKEKKVNNYYLTQTPQGFKYNKYYKEINNTNLLNAKDDIEIINTNKYKLNFIDGDKENIKITYKKDMEYVKKIISKTIKHGIGYDIHAFNFNSKKKLKLCGIKINYFSLKGHSDADVGFHAICDSIFGSLGLGDIGKIFKNTNPKWKDIDSKYFLEYAKKQLDQQNAKINNLDINFICEKPKIHLYSEKMKTKISNILKINKEIINIKATTNEKIGFIGNNQGIAAESIVTIEV